MFGNSLPRVYKFCIQWKEITWKILKDPNEKEDERLKTTVANQETKKELDISPPQRFKMNIDARRPKNEEDILACSTNDNIIIKSVAGFTSSGFLRKFMAKECLADLNLIKKSLRGISKELSVKYLENIIGECEDVENWVTEDFPINGKSYKKFKKWMLNPSADDLSEEEVNSIMRSAESFPTTFLRSVNELILKLQLLKNEIEESEDDPLTFEYVGYKDQPDKLLDLFDELKVNLFVRTESNSPKDFKAIFSGGPKIKPIVWYQSLEELWWFVKTLKDEGMLVNKKATNIRACNCFVKDGGAIIIADQLNGSHEPKTAELIQKIIRKNLRLGNPKKNI